MNTIDKQLPRYHLKLYPKSWTVVPALIVLMVMWYGATLADGIPATCMYLAALIATAGCTYAGVSYIRWEQKGSGAHGIPHLATIGDCENRTKKILLIFQKSKK